jgi:hypothetical protein
MPLLYRDVSVHLEGDKKNIQSLVSTLAASEAGGRSLWPFIRALSIYESPLKTENAKIPDEDDAVLQDLLSQSRGLETVRIYDASTIVTNVCERACKMSLLHLVVHPNPASASSRLLPIGRFAGLRTLHIATYLFFDDMDPSRENAWIQSSSCRCANFRDCDVSSSASRWISMTDRDFSASFCKRMRR